MDITIPKSLEALVRRKVDEGHYSTEDEVVADALRLMQARLGRADGALPTTPAASSTSSSGS